MLKINFATVPMFWQYCIERGYWMIIKLLYPATTTIWIAIVIHLLYMWKLVGINLNYRLAVSWKIGTVMVAVKYWVCVYCCNGLMVYSTHKWVLSALFISCVNTGIGDLPHIFFAGYSIPYGTEVSHHVVIHQWSLPFTYKNCVVANRFIMMHVQYTSHQFLGMAMQALFW